MSPDEPDGGDVGGDESGTEEPAGRCDFCRLRLPDSPVTVDHGDVAYRFCSRACRDRSESQDHEAAEYHGGWYQRPGVAALDQSLPQGIPRNSFVLFSSQSGTRDEAVLAETAWRTLERGEPAVVVSFLDSPTSVVQAFVDLDWNVLPYLESGQLRIVDCFTHLLDSPGRAEKRLNDWNHHLHDVADEATTVVEDPSNLSALLSRLDDALDDLDMHDEGAVFVDSLTELGSLVQPVKAYDFVKNVRAEVCKGRFVPVFASAALVTKEAEFPHDLGYMVDGVVDLGLDTETVPGTLLKRLRVRKMNGVLVVPEWHTYEYTAGDGMVVFDPREEVEKSRRRREARAKGADGGEFTFVAEKREDGDTTEADTAERDAAEADPETGTDEE